MLTSGMVFSSKAGDGAGSAKLINPTNINGFILKTTGFSGSIHSKFGHHFLPALVAGSPSWKHRWHFVFLGVTTYMYIYIYVLKYLNSNLLLVQWDFTFLSGLLVAEYGDFQVLGVPHSLIQVIGLIGP